jgi:EAL domain-containing protein (putative c-di-GMP-specific phosphodiesterase class I)/DNA-binding response OmpR family regulator
MNSSPGAGSSGPDVMPSLMPSEQGRWIVLLVDDEPEVHEITKLVLSNSTFESRPIGLHSAYSASEARDFLKDHPDTALILLDVVMETEDAGLGLVRHIRDKLENSDIQIVLRTGQPGMAPEREVILQYEINGYYLKTEITAQKLYSIVIAALRTYQYIRAIRNFPHRPTRDLTASTRGSRQRALQESLIRAVRSNECYLIAQPEIDLVSGKVVGIELLPNWKTDEVVVSVSQIAEILRAEDLRRQFDELSIRQGCAWTQSWNVMQPVPMRISVPILGDWLGDCTTLSMIDDCLAAFRIAPGTLDLEVSENTLLQKHPGSRDALAYLKARNVSVTVGDFGVGMISLPALYRMLPSRIKIHRSFVRNVSGDPEKAAIARAIIALAHTLGLGIVADGIVNDLDLQFLKWEGCDVGQGDLLAPSLAVSDVAQFLVREHTALH